MQVESIAECYPWSILQYFRPALSDNWVSKTNFLFFKSDPFTQVLLYIFKGDPSIALIQGSHGNSKTQFHDFSMIFHDQLCNFNDYLMQGLPF